MQLAQPVALRQAQQEAQRPVQVLVQRLAEPRQREQRFAQTLSSHPDPAQQHSPEEDRQWKGQPGAQLRAVRPQVQSRQKKPPAQQAQRRDRIR